MPSPSELVFSVICLTILFTAVSRTVGLYFFLSVGMIMLFSAWLQFINFDGSWPSNQPRIENYKMSKERQDRLDHLKYDAFGSSSTMTDQDWADYKRCKFNNVCVRRFQSIAEQH